MKKQNKKGFTLVELLVVIAILAILATVSVVGYSQFTKKAKESNDNTELHQYVTLIQAALVDGEEEVTVGSAKYKVTYTDTNGVGVQLYDATNKEYGVTAENVEEVVKVLINETDLTKLSTGGVIAATYATEVLTIKYTHNITDVNASNVAKWTIGKAA